VAEVAELAGADEVGERAEGLVEVDGRVPAVDLVEVEVVGAEAAQRVLDRDHDPAAGAAAVVRVVVEGHEELRREHDVVAASGEGLADDDLGLALGVDVGGVDEVDPGVQRPVDGLDAFVVVLGAPLAEHHGAEAQLADTWTPVRPSGRSSMVVSCYSAGIRRMVSGATPAPTTEPTIAGPYRSYLLW
jgi:hypothetical protein